MTGRGTESGSVMEMEGSKKDDVQARVRGTENV